MRRRCATATTSPTASTLPRPRARTTGPPTSWCTRSTSTRRSRAGSRPAAHPTRCASRSGLAPSRRRRRPTTRRARRPRRARRGRAASRASASGGRGCAWARSRSRSRATRGSCCGSTPTTSSDRSHELRRRLHVRDRLPRLRAGPSGNCGHEALQRALRILSSVVRYWYRCRDRPMGPARKDTRCAGSSGSQ
jgi:hypothetical protein